MMDVLAHDIMPYEMLSEQDEYKALAYVLQGNESEEFELCGISSTFLISSFSCIQL
jgi:hypothetical protein